MNTAGIVVLVIALAAIAGIIGWIVFTRIRAQRLGLPPPPLKSYIPFLKSSSSYSGPSPAPGGPAGWFSDRMRMFRHGRNKRTAAGAYEGQSYNAGYASTSRHRGFEHDDDDPWDSRVGHGPDEHNPYEEEREMGLVSRGGQPGGEGYEMNLPVGPDEEERRGRTRSRSPGPVPGAATKANPFGDDAEPSNISLRGVSPRPMDASFAARKAARGEEDRRSVFREEV